MPEKRELNERKIKPAEREEGLVKINELCHFGGVGEHRSNAMKKHKHTPLLNPSFFLDPLSSLFPKVYGSLEEGKPLDK
ncbi:unnamed protein product [Enterobius vermicularis]|uniref:Uncharacterized protein n=1 Tax=Enterobius vermicularis TaxID=51028 RepID=A0A0N4V158_ENTVE|nr:unnamed protein product [Enterobius vermicularis]